MLLFPPSFAWFQQETKEEEERGCADGEPISAPLGAVLANTGSGWIQTMSQSIHQSSALHHIHQTQSQRSSGPRGRSREGIDLPARIHRNQHNNQ